MTTDTNIIDMTDRIVTAEIAIPKHRAETRIMPAVVTTADDTVRIPTYMGAPMLPPVPARPGALPLLGRPGAVPTGARRAAAILGAMSLGAAVAPIVLG